MAGKGRIVCVASLKCLFCFQLCGLEYGVAVVSLLQVCVFALDDMEREPFSVMKSIHCGTYHRLREFMAS